MIADILKSIQELPDGMAANAVADEFRKLLPLIRNLRALSDREMAVEALEELSDRQWHTYELLSPDLRAEIDEWIQNSWDFSSAKFTRSALAVIPRIGLKRSLDYARAVRNERSLSTDIRAEIDSALNEYGGTVDDPYSGMR